MKRIYYMLHGSIQCCTPTNESDDFIAMVISKDIPKDATNVVVLDSDKIKANPNFYEAWTIVNNDIQIDMNAAGNCKLKKIRDERDLILQSTDIPYNVGVERGKDVSSLRMKRQALRDLPNNISFSGLSLDQIDHLDPLASFR